MEAFLLEHFEELPALRFFWADNVAPENRGRFCKKLAQLYELFMAPHTLPVPPYRDLSYLKKYEHFHAQAQSYNKLAKHLIQVLQIDHPNIKAYFPFSNIEIRSRFLGRGTENPEVPQSFKHPFSFWYQVEKDKDVFTCPIRLVFGEGEGHAMFFSAKRVPLERKVKMVAIDPHGFKYGPSSARTDRDKLKVIQVLKEYIETELKVEVEEVLFMCPQLQKWEQGNNCYQWYIYLFALFMTTPELFGAPKLKLDEVGLYPNANMHLFELSMFLRTMPKFMLDNYYHVTALQRDANWDMLEEDGDARDGDSDVLGMPNCYAAKLQKRCPFPCALCGDTCNYPEAVENVMSGEHCKPKSPKQIAKKMFVLYAAIRNMTGQDPNSMTAADIQQQLNFKEAKTVEEFKQIYRKTDYDLQQRESKYQLIKDKLTPPEPTSVKSLFDYLPKTLPLSMMLLR